MGTSKLGVEMLNRSQLSDGKKFKCVGSHIAGPESGASCVVQIRESGLLCPGVLGLLAFSWENHLKEGLGKKSKDVRMNRIPSLSSFLLLWVSFLSNLEA